MKTTRLTTIFLAMMLTCHWANAQELHIGFSTGLKWNKMDDIKYIFDQHYEHVLKYQHDAKVVHDFPAYFSYGPFLRFDINRTFSFGLKYSFKSTGARISRADYSGNMHYDHILKCHSPVITTRINFVKTNNLLIGIYTDVGWEKTKLKTENYTDIYGHYYYSDVYEYESENWYWESGLAITYRYKRYEFGANCGYHYDFEKQYLTNVESDGWKLQMAYNEYAKADWTGLHVSLSVSMNLLQKKGIIIYKM